MKIWLSIFLVSYLLPSFINYLVVLAFDNMSQLRKRRIVDTLLTSTNYSPKEIARRADVSLATVYNMKSRRRSHSKLEHKKGAGRPKTLRNRIKPSLCQQIRRKPYLSLRTLASQESIGASFSTVGRALRDLDYSKHSPSTIPMLSEKNRLYRIKWAKKYAYPKKAWSQTILDEMSIWLSRGNLQMWAKSGRKRLVPTVKHTPKINVWAAFSSMGTFPLCIFTHNMNSDMFLWILRTHLISQACVFHENEWRVVMDNDPKHKSKVVKNFLDENLPNQIPWPSQCPDLNPIENLFGWVKSELMKIGPKTISELKKSLEKIWNNIQPEFLKPYWSSMPRRCKMVINSNGHPINY